MCDFIPNRKFCSQYSLNEKLIRVEIERLASRDNSVRVPFKLSFWTTDSKVIRSFIETCRDHYTQEIGINIYTWTKDSGWIRLSKKQPRSLDTIYLKPEIKTKLQHDLINFQNSKAKYHAHGVPYRRSYLLYGPGGTGKSSTIFSVAGYLGYDIYIFNLADPDLSDNEVLRAIQEVYSKSIVVFEDLDFIIERMQQPDTNMSLTLAGIYNILDGISMPSDLLIFITTNSLDKIPRNLMRPGRVNRIFHFDYLDADQFTEILTSFYPNLEVTEFVQSLDLGSLQLTSAEIINWLMNLDSESNVIAEFATFLAQRVSDSSLGLEAVVIGEDKEMDDSETTEDLEKPK
jgi:chaperone BCS1